MEHVAPTEEDFATTPQNAGEYRGRPLDWTIKEYDSGSTALIIRFKITNMWYPGKGDEPGTWDGEWPQGYYVQHKAWIIGADGEPKDGAITNLAKCGLWFGDFDAIAKPPPAVHCLLSVENEPWKGKDVFLASWVNPDAPEPTVRTGGFAPVEPEALAAMRAKFGGKMKAIAGAAKGAASDAAAGQAASGRPAPPAPPGAPGGGGGPVPAGVTTASPPEGQPALDDESTPFD